MRQVWITKAGPPEVLQVREAPDPVPGPGMVRIRAAAAGINFADVLARLGIYPDAPKIPCVVGYEVAGRIDAVGTGVSERAVGEEVLALVRFGGYSDVVCVHEKQALLIPTGMTHSQAVAIPVNYGTAYQMMVVMGSLKPSERVLIHGAGGGVGLAAIDIAKIIGAESLGTASAAKHEALLRRGLGSAIDYRTKDFEQEVKRLTGGRGVHLVLDPIGGASWVKSFRCLAPTGRLAVFGFSAAVSGKTRSLLALARNVIQIPWFKFNPLTLMSSNKAVIGVNVGHLWGQSDLLGSWLRQLLDWYREGKINPTVDHEFPLADAAAAHHYIQDRKNVGKVVLVP